MTFRPSLQGGQGKALSVHRNEENRRAHSCQLWANTIHFRHRFPYEGMSDPHHVHFIVIVYFILAFTLVCIFTTHPIMSWPVDAHHDIPWWMLEVFDDPLWQQHTGPRRRNESPRRGAQRSFPIPSQISQTEPWRVD